MGQLVIKVTKVDDGELVKRWLAAARDAGMPTVYFNLAGEAVAHNVPAGNPEQEPRYKLVEQFAALGGASLTAGANVPNVGVRLERKAGVDEIVLDVSSGDLPKAAAVAAALQKHFGRIDVEASLIELFDNDQKRYYQQREATLIRLEQLTEKLINQNEQQRLRVEQEKADYRKQVDAQYEKQEGALAERRDALDKREQEMDLADAKSSRRKLRLDIQGRLIPTRTVNVGIRKTWPIHLIFVAASCTLAFLMWTILRSPGFDPLQIAHAVKLGLTSVGLIGTLLLYFRWMDSWIRTDVDEELRLRQLAIDVDRATWVIEMLSELKGETERPVPDEVLAAITRNLFTGRDSTRAVTHPAEDALAALLGAAREVEVDFPGGGKVRADAAKARKKL